MCAAAGVARHRDTGGIHFLARKQIIQGTDAIPNRVARDGVTDQKALRSLNGVFRRGTAQLGASKILVIDLDTFPLPQRVPCECDVTTPRQRDQHLLPGRVGLAPEFVTQRI